MRVRVDNLSHWYRNEASAGSVQVAGDALRVASLCVPSGTHLCLTGRSGSGKTTLLNIVAGLLRPQQGEVWLGDIGLHTLREERRDAVRARHVGYVFQTSQLMQGLSVSENLTLAQYFAGVSAGEAKKRVHQLLEPLGLGALGGRRPSQLSVGQLQRVGIARAVCKQPSVVLADEPTASLDDRSASQAMDVLLSQCQNRTLIVASHDGRLIERMQAAGARSVALEEL